MFCFVSLYIYNPVSVLFRAMCLILPEAERDFHRHKQVHPCPVSRTNHEAQNAVCLLSVPMVYMKAKENAGLWSAWSAGIEQRKPAHNY